MDRFSYIHVSRQNADRIENALQTLRDDLPELLEELETLPLSMHFADCLVDVKSADDLHSLMHYLEARVQELRTHTTALNSP